MTQTDCLLADDVVLTAALLSGIKPEADKVQAIFILVRVCLLRACVYEVKHAFDHHHASLSLLCVFPKTEKGKNTRFQDLDFPLSGCFFLLFSPHTHQKKPKFLFYKRSKNTQERVFLNFVSFARWRFGEKKIQRHIINTHARERERREKRDVLAQQQAARRRRTSQSRRSRLSFKIEKRCGVLLSLRQRRLLHRSHRRSLFTRARTTENESSVRVARARVGRLRRGDGTVVRNRSGV